jgi:hypothetical protein
VQVKEIDAAGVFVQTALVRSGAVTSSGPWLVDLSRREIAWSTPSARRRHDANPPASPNASAVRWGTTDTLSVVSDHPPLGSDGVRRFRSGDTQFVSLIAEKAA